MSVFGGDLVSLQTSSEQTFVKGKASGSTNAVWIGLNDRLVRNCPHVRIVAMGEVKDGGRHSFTWFTLAVNYFLCLGLKSFENRPIMLPLHEQ